MTSYVKGDQRVFGRRDSSFSVTPEVHSHLCGITKTKGDREHITNWRHLFIQRGFEKKINLIWGNQNAIATKIRVSYQVSTHYLHNFERKRGNNENKWHAQVIKRTSNLSSWLGDYEIFVTSLPFPGKWGSGLVRNSFASEMFGSNSELVVVITYSTHGIRYSRWYTAFHLPDYTTNRV